MDGKLRDYANFGSGGTYFVHLLEVWHLVKIAHVEDSEVLDPVGNL